MPSPYNPSQISGGIIDVFHGDNNSRPIGWGAVASANRALRAVIAKATQGASFIDPQWVSNRRAASAAGLMVGAYHFCTADDPDAQVDHFISAVGGLDGVVLFLDWESPDSENPTFEPAVLAGVERMATRVRMRALRPAGIYCGRSMLSAPSTILSACPLWLPEYGGDPICPPGWDKWRLHQFTDSERISGIDGEVDASMHDDTQGSLASLWTEFGHAQPSPIPQPVQTAPIASTALTVSDAPRIVAALQNEDIVRAVQTFVGAEPVDGILGKETATAIGSYRAQG